MSEGGGRELSLWELAEAPREARRLRRLPGLLVRGLRFVGAADRAGLVAVVLLAVGTGAAAGLQVLATQRVLTEVLAAGRDAAGLGAALPALVLLAALNLGLGLAGTVREGRREVLTERVNQYAEAQVLGVTTRVGLEDFDDPLFHERVQRAVHGAQFGPMSLVQGVVGLVSGLLGAAGLLLALGTIAPVLVVVVLVAYLPVWAALQSNGLDRFRMIMLQTPLERRRGYVFGLLTDRWSAKEVLAYGLAPELRRRWGALGAERLTSLTASVRRRTLRSLAGDGAGQLLGASALLLLAWLVATGRLSVPEAGAAGAALVGLQATLFGIAMGAGQLFEASLFVADYEAFLALGGRLADRPPGAPAPAGFARVTVEGVTFRYPGAERPAVDGVDLTLGAGEVVALVGENGSGKTTLAKIVAGLYRPAQGRVAWDGRDAAEYAPEELRRHVAVVFQDFAQYAFSGHENIALGDVERLADVDGVRAAARRADADGLLSALPEGYATVLARMFGEGGADLSIGQWQRVALARAFFRDAPLVILDEPTAALDARAEHDLFERIRDLYAERTVLLVSHRFSTVRTADRIYVLDRGRVAEHGSHDELMAAGGRYAELFTLQASAYLAGDDAGEAAAPS